MSHHAAMENENPGTCAFVLKISCALEVLVLACIAMPGSALAQAVPGIEIQGENDGLSLWLPQAKRTDGEYTNGLRVSLSRGIAPVWGRLLRSSASCDGTEAIPRRCLTTEFAIAQQIYTPLNAENEPRPIDRPFVGWLHGDITANVISSSRLRSFTLIAGFTGPPTLASDVQRAFHRGVGVTNGDGWNYQLPFALAGSLAFRERVRTVLVSSNHRAVADVLSSWSVQAGNSRTDAYGELVVRAGLRLPHPWNPASRVREGVTAFGIWVYGGFRETGVAYDQTLDRRWSRGSSSYSVQRIPWVGRSEFGIGLRRHSLTMTFGGAYDGREYRTEFGPHAYGSLTVSVDHGHAH